MIKIAIASAVMLGAAAPAMAGPYVNVEANSGFVGSDYQGTVTEAHVGFEGALGDSASFYGQAGPAFVAADGQDLSTEFSGKVGIGVAVVDALSVYGEVSFITGEDDNGYGTKLGVKYSF